MSRDDWVAMWFGHSWRVCSLLIAVFAVPIGGALVALVCQFAPTLLRATAAVVGLASGTASATLCSLRYPEVGANFVLIWYSLGIAVTGGIGAALGPKLLRW